MLAQSGGHILFNKIVKLIVCLTCMKVVRVRGLLRFLTFTFVFLLLHTHVRVSVFFKPQSQSPLSYYCHKSILQIISLPLHILYYVKHFREVNIKININRRLGCTSCDIIHRQTTDTHKMWKESPKSHSCTHSLCNNKNHMHIYGI